MDSSSRAFRSTTYWKDLFLIGGFLWATVEIVLRALAGNSKEFHPSVRKAWIDSVMQSEA
jgi:hypothetical protein